MKCSLGISNFLEEISSLSYSILFLLYSRQILYQQSYERSPNLSLPLKFPLNKFSSPLTHTLLLDYKFLFGHDELVLELSSMLRSLSPTAIVFLNNICFDHSNIYPMVFFDILCHLHQHFKRSKISWSKWYHSNWYDPMVIIAVFSFNKKRS